MYGNPSNPYWWMTTPSVGVGFPGARLRRLDTGGIFELSTNAVQLTEASVDYGINPACYNALPCESIVLLRVHADAPTGGENLPVNIVTPNGGQTTISGTDTGTTKVPVVDSKNTPVTGSDVVGTTERLAYINKRTGVIRFLEFTAGSTASASSNTTPAAASVKVVNKQQ